MVRVRDPNSPYWNDASAFIHAIGMRAKRWVESWMACQFAWSTIVHPSEAEKARE